MVHSFRVTTVQETSELLRAELTPLAMHLLTNYALIVGGFVRKT